MNWLVRILITLLLSATVLVSLSRLVQLDDEASKLRAMTAVTVGDSNIVDVMLEAELQLRIRRVEVLGKVVSVDLQSSASTNEEVVMQDMARLPQHLFTASTNIEQLFIRVMDGSAITANGGAKLLIASNTLRSGWGKGIDPLTEMNASSLRSYLENHSRMTYTAIWKERFEESIQ